MRKAQRRRFWLYTVVTVFAQPLASEALAQSYPNKPVRMVVGMVAGGGTDVTARLVAQKLSEHLGQPVVVENRPGASTAIGTERVAKSPTDGYTLLMLSCTTSVLSAMRTNLPYDLERDFAPVSMVTTAPLVLLVHPSVPARDVKELIALARSRPGKLNYGSSGVGGISHLAGELFSLMAKVKLVHVPFKGGGESVIASASGQVDMNFPSVATATPLHGAGKLRALAVSSAKRSSLLPSIPTLDESGLPGYDLFCWWGVLAPAAVPKDIIAQLNAVIGKIVNTPEMKESINKQGMEPQTNSLEQFAAFMRNEMAQYAKLVKLAGLKIE
ncbi:MAG: tripartite tricarboxylate transporter substrate binding protein [Betaproteobacteria bacterium]|nr:tripartite tricarboxylate transporter substrate binding protein [Betaproteobacteria bacterium]